MAKKKSFLDELKEIESGSSYVSTSTRTSSSHKKSFLDELKDIEINGYTPNDLNTTIKSNETTEQPKQKKWLTAEEILSGANFTNRTDDNNISTNNANRDFEISVNDTRQKKQSMESYINNYIENNKNSLKYQNYIGSTEDKEKQLRYDAMRTKDYMDLEKQYLESKNKTDKLDKQAHGSFFKQAEGSKITGIEAIDNVLNTGINVGVSLLDAGEHALHGLVSTAEQGIDGVRYILADDYERIAKKHGNEGLKAYSENLKNQARQNTTEDVRNGIMKTIDPSNILDSRSYLAPRSESIAESVGQSAGYVVTAAGTGGMSAVGQTAIQSGVTYLSAYGNARTQAYEMGMNEEDAKKYATINGLTEAFTEAMFGQFTSNLIPGKVKGVNSGILDVDDRVANALTSKMKSGVMKSLNKYVIKSGFEGLEEVAGAFIRPTAYKTFMNDYFKDVSWKELFEDEHAMDSFVDGMISAMISSAPGVHRNIKTQTDYITGNTYKEDAIIDSEVKFRQEEAEKKKGSELTKEEKKTIKAEVEEDLETGDLNVDRIERQLNPEGVAKIEELQKKYDNAIEQTEKEELGKQLNEAKLEHYKFMEEELKSNNKLNATYREEALRKEEFKPTLKEGDKDFTEETKRLYEEVKKANANNSTRTHNVVNSANKFQNENGTAYHFVNTEQIKKINEQRKELGLKPYIENANGFVGDNGEVYINLDSRNALNSIIGHETTHLLESSGKINKLRDLVQEFAETKGIWSERLKKVEEIYKKNKVDADARAELVNDIVGEYMFTDEDFVRHLSKKDMNIFQSFFNNIKNAIKYVTAGSKEERQLEKAKQLYEKIYREVKQADNDGTIKNSLYLNNKYQNEELDSIVNRKYADTNESAFPVYDNNDYFFVEVNGTSDYNIVKHLNVEQRKAIDNFEKKVENYETIKSSGERFSRIIEGYRDIIEQGDSRDNGTIEERNLIQEYDWLLNPRDSKQYFDTRKDNEESSLSTKTKELDNSSFSNEKNNVEYSLSDDGALQDQEGNKVKLETSDTGTTGTLMAIHNLTEDKLKGILELGGFPVPSIAITNDYTSNQQFGNISVLFDKNTINPEVEANKVYSRDGYTTRIPKVINALNPEGLEQVSKNTGMETWDLKSRYEEKPMQDAIDDMKRRIEVIDKYLDEKGITVEPVYREFKGYAGLTSSDFNDFIKNNPDFMKLNITDKQDFNTYEKYYPAIHELYIQNAIEKGKGNITRDVAEGVLDGFPRYSQYQWFLNSLEDSQKVSENGKEIDDYATKEAKLEAIGENSKEYNDYVKNLVSPMFGDKYIRNNKDYYTSSGNPRSFNQRYDTYTLDNIVRIMNENKGTGQEGGFFSGINELAADSSIRFKSLDDIKNNENLLQKMNIDELEKIRKEYNDRLFDIQQDIIEQYGELDTESTIWREKSIGESIKEIARKMADGKKINADKVINSFSKNYININESQANDIIDLINDLKNLPTDYFEAKPQRAVGLDEVQQIVIPNTLDAEFKKQLQDAGLQYTEYDPSIEGDRQRVINQFDNLKFSLSKEIAPIRGGIYSKDILLPTKEEKGIDLPRRATEQDLDAMEKQFSERLPEYIPYEEPETISTYEKTKADIRRIGQDIKKELGLRTRDMHNVYEAVDTFLNKENLSANDLYNYFDKIYDNTITLPNDTYNDFVEDLKNTPFSVSDKVKNDVLDYKNRRSEHMGQLVINDYSRNIDVAYEELREKYPMLPVEYNESAMLENIFDMLDSNDTIQVQDLSENDLKEVLMDSADKVYADIKQMKYEKQMKQEQSTRKLAEQEVYNASKTMKKVKIAYEGQDSYKKTRSMIQEELLNEGNITIDDIDVGKDIVALNYQITDPVRVNEKVFGAEVGQKINEFTTYHVRHNEAESIRWQNAEREEIKALDIKSKREKALVQKYGEKQYVNEFGDLVEFGDKELAKEVKSDKEFEKIKHAAEVIRSKYDNYIDMANNVLTEMGYDPIPKRKDYMRHFEELSDKFSQWGVPLNLETLNKENLPTDINGLTDMNRPGKAYFASANRRTGVKTTYDAIKGIDGYISGIADVIYHTEDIQRYRALSKFIRETYGQTKGFEHLDGLTEQEQIKRIDDIQSNKLSGYAAWLDNQANLLANKKTKIDRGFEEVFGRRVYGVLETAKKQVGSNMTGLNFRSALTNFASTIQAFGKTNKIATIKGYASTIRNLFVNDNLIQQSDFLTDRFGTDMLNKKMWQKVSNYGQIFMTGTDYLTSNMIWRSKYFESLGKGYNNTESIKIADDFAARIMGDRSKGQTAAIFSSKTLGLFTQFQLEVNNQWQAMIHDNKMAIERKQMTTAGLIWQFGQLTALSAIFNEIMTNLTGSDVMLDPYEIFKELFAPDDDDEDLETRLQRVEKNILDNLPMGNLITGGGRIPINEAFKGLTSVIKKSVGGKNEYGNEITWEDVKSDTLDSLGYWLLPTGYGQVKKTKKGLDMYNHDTPGAYTKSGNLKYEVNDDILTKIQAMLFGASANPGAREYYDKGYRALKPDEVKEAKDYGMSINKYREFMEGLESVSKTRVENENGTLTRYTDGINTYWYNKDTKQVYNADMKKVSKDITKLEKVSASDEKYKYIKNLDLPTSTKTKIINNELGKNSTITDNYGYVKYKDSDNKVYWYDEDTGKLYDSKYRQSTKNVRSLTKVSNTMTNSDINKYNSLDDYNSVSSNPTKQKLIEQVGTNKEYQSYRDEIENIKDQYASNDNMTSKQKTKQSQVRKRKVQEYINTLPLNVPQKLILQKLSGYSVKDYKSELRPYINSLNISKEEKEKLDKELFD